MNVSLAFCRIAYETIIEKEMPSSMPYSQAGNEAFKQDKERFKELHKEYSEMTLDEQFDRWGK